MQFHEALRYLLSLGHETLAIKLGLRNTELLLAALGDPHRSYPAVQIAGTNGKGSTAVVLDSICAAAGIKSGLFTSPHLVSITERVRIGGQEISQESFAQYATQISDAAQQLVDRGDIEVLPTFFEQLTAIALVAFREAKVDLAILETGLGGRLDSTSAARADLVAITPIAIDHEEYLGNTLESIAAEKAAIIRPGVTAIIAPQSAQALDVILRQCGRSNVQPSIANFPVSLEDTSADGRCYATFETRQDRYEHVLLGLRGRHQTINVAVAIRLAESLPVSVPRWAIIEGIERASHSGRLELWETKPPFLFDGAHNVAGAQALRDYLDEFVRSPLTLVFGAMRDKNLDEMAAILFGAASQLVLTRSDNERAARIEKLREVASRVLDQGKISTADSVKDAIRIALNITPQNGLICVTGSLYLIGEAQSAAKEITALKSEK
jgi:dihydrofolate synthase/folylpolyglutamate synthase